MRGTWIGFCGLCLLLLFGYSCGESEPDGPSRVDSFDRKAMLTHWADKMIIPAYEAYVGRLGDLKARVADFEASSSPAQLEDLRRAYIEAYKAWQQVSMFDIGPAEASTLRNYTNVYPADTTLIQNHIDQGSYNLDLPSNFDAQGFPALDYLLYGKEDENMSYLSDGKTQYYIADIVKQMDDYASHVLDSWRNTYRTSFVERDGASATSSVDKLTNDYLFYYEKHLRAGKVGIPAGVFSGNALPQTAEGLYSGHSQELMLVALDAVEAFFVGEAYDGQSSGPSLESYLGHISEQNQTANISAELKQHWQNARVLAQGIDRNFATQAESDVTQLLGLYDELQKAVVLLKVDMMQALNIQVDYVDADGD